MQPSKDLLSEIYSKIKSKELIDEDFINYLESIFPDKSPNILEVIKRGITKYTFKPSNRIVWTAMGENNEYLIYPKIYCGCIDFYKNVIINRIRDFCKHIIAQIICEALNNYKEKKLEDNNFGDFINDLKLED
jgi:predicted nucleic acid-binding Zn finger protein